MASKRHSAEKDELLLKAEDLAVALPAGAKNEMQRALHYFVRHRDYNDLISLLRRPLPWYGRLARNRWNGVRDVLTNKKMILQQYTPDEIAFILGWTARLLQ